METRRNGRNGQKAKRRLLSKDKALLAKQKEKKKIRGKEMGVTMFLQLLARKKENDFNFTAL